MESSQSRIQFRQYTKYPKSDSTRTVFEVAFSEDRLIENPAGTYLSRIPKKNGKHRYYLTDEFEQKICNGCGVEDCSSRSCRGGWDYKHYFTSKYAGKNLEVALSELFCPTHSSRISTKTSEIVRPVTDLSNAIERDW